MCLHHVRQDAGAVFRSCEALHCPQFGKGLKPILRCESPVMLLIFAEVDPTVPDAPIMIVATLVGVAQLFIVGTGRARPIGYLGVETGLGRSEHATKLRQIVLPDPLVDRRRKLTDPVPIAE